MNFANMEEAIVSLKKNGWNVSLEKIKLQFDNSESESREEKRFLRDPEKWLLDQDLKNVALTSFLDGINSGKITELSTPVVLQIKNVAIISAPKQNIDSEAAPRMLKVALTDGKSVCYGIEFEHISKISLATLPGTKIRLIRDAKVWNGFILLNAKNFQYLGGEVPDLIEEWKVQRLLLGHVRSQEQDGPPPWVPFGRRIQPLNIPDGQDKKTLDEKEKVVKDEEFLSQRQDAIAAAADASGVTKVIEGSGRRLEMQPTERRGRGRERRERTSYRDDERSAKPPDSIRLFEFLQPQIGEKPEEEKTTDYNDQNDNGGEEQEGLPSWERGNLYHRLDYGRSRGGKPYAQGRGSYQHHDDINVRGRRGSHRGRGGSYHDDSSYQDRRESYRGRGGSYHDDSSYEDRRESYRGRGRSNRGELNRVLSRESHRGRGSHDRYLRGVSIGTTFRGHRSSDFDQEQSYGGRGQSFPDDRLSFRKNSHTNHRSSNRDRSSSRSSVDVPLVDFNAWPELEAKPPAQQLGVQEKEQSASRGAHEQFSRKFEDYQDSHSDHNRYRRTVQWAAEDYCLAKKQSSDKYAPSIIKQLHPNRKSATVMFIESGAVAIVETKYLRHDPQDENNGQSVSSRPRGSQLTRMYSHGEGW